MLKIRTFTVIPQIFCQDWNPDPDQEKFNKFNKI